MTTETARSLYITALRNTHGLEEQSLQAMERQVERLEHYPELERALRRHIAETKQQRERIDAALASMDESASAVKEAVMGFVGNLAAAAHMPAQDEILKNIFVNQGLENYEIAAYKSLLVFAEAAGDTKSLASFKQSLNEEEAMASEINAMIDPITRRYLSLTLRVRPESHDARARRRTRIMTDAA